MHPTAVLNVVALNRSLLEHAPNLHALAQRGELRRLQPVLPAVTCSVQSSMLTGRPVRDHGVVGNGWYNAELCEVQFWKQSNRLVQAEKVWETARRRDPSFTCANCFWWYNMHSSADVSVTPRPIYKADGRKIPDIYAEPPDLRDELQRKLGRFPLFKFWGPAASIESTRWIADSAMEVYERFQPTLTLVYLPHLDYGLQKLGPEHPSIPQHVREVDEVAGELLRFFQDRGVRLIVLSEYGIESVSDSVHINRVLRGSNLLRVREEEGLELLDAGASDAFAVADHQVAHVYLREPASSAQVASLLREQEGVERVLDREEQRGLEIDHPRTGDLVLVAARGRWFSYDYWLDEARAPDFARTVDIHRKPGYDPLELFIDPSIRAPKAKLAGKLLRKKLGFRTLMDVIPLDTSLVRGSHGRIDQPPDEQPVLITQPGLFEGPDELPCQSVRDVLLTHLFDR